jgi:hypothetical protein
MQALRVAIQHDLNDSCNPVYYSLRKEHFEVLDVHKFGEIKELLSDVWNAPTQKKLLSKKLDVANYEELRRGVPDKVIIIKEVFPKDQLEEIWTNYVQYLGDYEIAPFLGTFGETVICIGYGATNRGKIYCYDFDFGCFPLNDDLTEFLSKLIDPDMNMISASTLSTVDAIKHVKQGRTLQCPVCKTGIVTVPTYWTKDIPLHGIQCPNDFKHFMIHCDDANTMKEMRARMKARREKS